MSFERVRINLDFEQALWNNGVKHVAGVDEAGRGPLAGPVVAAAVIMPRNGIVEGIDDSKKLSANKREEVYGLIRQTAVSIGVSIISHSVIDEVNIFEATMRAMREAVSQLSPVPGHLLVDGTHYRGDAVPCTTVIGGDARCISIAAASIVAKVTRDELMVQLDEKFPQYGFAKHKGYGTKDHLAALRKHGPCEIHRRSFRMPLNDGALNGQ